MCSGDASQATSIRTFAGEVFLHSTRKSRTAAHTIHFRSLTDFFTSLCCRPILRSYYTRIYVLSSTAFITMWAGRLANEASLADAFSALVLVSRRRTRIVCCKPALQRRHGSAEHEVCKSKKFLAPVQHMDDKVSASFCARDVRAILKAAYCDSYSALSMTDSELIVLMSLEIRSSVCLVFYSICMASRTDCAAVKSSVPITTWNLRLCRPR